MVTNKNIINKLQKTPMFKYYPEKELMELVVSGVIREYKQKDVIVKDGDLNSSIYIVVSGCVDITVSDNSQEVYVCTLGEGEVFGEAGLFSRVKRTANVLASESSVVLEMKRESLLMYLKMHGASGHQLLLVIIYSLLKKLKWANQEISFDRKSDMTQDDIDEIIKELITD